MKKVIIYPGRFQPMLSHHAEVYKQLQSQFSDADVYIGTSDKVEGEKSPFNFKEKQQIAQAHGIDPSKVLLAKRPYHKDDYPFDEDNTVIIFAVGEKDLDRFPFNNVDTKTGLDMTVRGEPKPKYYQKINTYRTDPKPMAERGYITLAPTVKTGDEVASASAFRQAFKDAPDSASAKEIFLKQFGEYNQKVFDLLYNKIKGTEMSEQLNILRKLAGMEPISEAPVQMPDFEKGERPKNAKEREAYRKWKQSQSAKAKADDDSPVAISPKDKKAAAERPAKAAAADPMAVGFTKIKPEDMVDARSKKPIPSKQRQKSIANQFPADADINDPAVKKEVFLKVAAKRPDLMFGEINARLANDDEGLAASDRLSPIVRELEDSRNLMSLDAEDKKFALRLLQNAIDNMEMVRATDIDKAIDVEPMQLDVDDDNEPEIGDDEIAPVLDMEDEPVRDSVNFDDIRAEYDIKEEDDEEPEAKVVPVNKPVQLAGDSIWDRDGENPSSVNVKEITVNAIDPEDNHYSVSVSHDGPWSIYTDSGFEEEISNMLGFGVTFSEQGMQEDGEAHMDVDVDLTPDQFAKIKTESIEEGDGTEHHCQKCEGNGCDECDDTGVAKEYQDESAPFGDPSQQDELADRLSDAYEKGGEEGLCKEAGCTLEELDNEIQEICREKGLHPDDDRDECIQLYIEELVDNADYKDHGEYESVEHAIEETADNALESAMVELRKLAGIN